MVPLDSSAISTASLCPIGECLFDRKEHRLFQGKIEVVLRPKSLSVLQYLVEHRGHLVPKSDLLEAVWPNSFVSENSLTQCLTEVRRALGNRERGIIKTIFGRGYLLQADEDPGFNDLSADTNSVDGGPIQDSLEQDDSRCNVTTTDPGGNQTRTLGIASVLWQKRLDLYLNLCHTTSTICNLEPESTERANAETVFWILYSGQVPLVADERYVNPAVKAFGSAVKAGAPNEVLRILSFKLASDCRKSLESMGARSLTVF